MADSPGYLKVRAGDGTLLNTAVMTDTNGAAIEVHSVRLTDGTMIGPGVPMPTSDAVAGTALGVPSDAAWSGTGSASVVAALKAVWTALKGTLTATISGALPAGTNAIGTVGVTALPALAAGTNTIGAVGVTALPANGVTVTVTTVTLSANTDAQLIAVNPNRKSLAIWNTGSGLLSLGFGAAAAAGTGVTYGSTGQAIGRTWGLGDGVPTQAIHGISAAGTTVVIEEGV